MFKRLTIVITTLLLVTGLLTLSSPEGPALTPTMIWDSLLHVERSPLTNQQKLALVLPLRTAFEKAGYPEDSVYARILHRIAVFQYYTTREYNSCVENTLRAIRINT